MKPSVRQRPAVKTAAKAMGRSKVMERHVHQFQIACLELERTRRMKELSVASQRVTDINSRLEEIEREILAHTTAMLPLPEHHLRVVAGGNAPAEPQPKAPRNRQTVAQEPVATEGKRRTLRY